MGTRVIDRLLSASWMMLVAALVAAPATAASFDQSNTAIGSASATSCSGIGYSPGATPGVAWVPGINGANGATVCNNATGANPGVSSSATGSTAPNPFPYVDSSTASAAVQQIHLLATHSGDSGYFFPEAYAQGGWNESLTLGISGTWVFPIAVTGTFTSTGPNGSADGYVEVFKNGQDYQNYGPTFTAAYNTFAGLNATHNGCVGPSGWSPEMVGWGVTGDRYPGTCPATLSPSTVWFALDVTAGQSFQLGIWASIRAGQYSAGNASPDLLQDTATADLGHTFLWGGPGYVIDGNGQTVRDFNISSASGANYNVAAVDTAATPEPSTEAMLAGGLAALLLVAHYRARPATHG